MIEQFLFPITHVRYIAVDDPFLYMLMNIAGNDGRIVITTFYDLLQGIMQFFGADFFNR